MYTFSSKLKTFSFALMIVGLLGVAYGFLSTPNSVEDVKVMLQESHDSHGEVATSHDNVNHGESHETAHSDDTHAEHAFHYLKNKPWSALYVALFFFFMISLATLAFYAIQHASQAGWPVVLFRVMEGITAYLPVGAVLLFVFFVLSSLHMNHLFTWMDADVVAHDELIQNKSGYLNVPFFLLRAAIYIIGWVVYRQYARKLTLAQDKANDNSNYTKLFKSSAAFLVFFLVSESMMSWDWIMSLDPHWFSTLFGWYVFASMIVSAVTTIALISIYLKGKGYLEFVNNSHLHDLAKFMFGFSIFWTYLWFSQFMLIWYANIPEEVTYFASRFSEYKIPFLGMLVLNFAFPLLVLMNSDFKRVNWFIVCTGIIILIGHYVDIFVMIMPATVGDQWFFGISEISSVLLVLGLFIYVVFTALTKAPLLAKGNPFIKESEHFHY
ncbi:quinol:cytochrome C oxidoreductase [uncultured Lutibacter sp.]|uniref:quinol:cytochrome C oxidoreductase n=1 Tax=uncultured Lutibacter sp. TaxID=437739 RepID=UPI00262A35BC|nr:quinol:cytochrome C oxidoreductase [uncultured Lutibacter sp.]